MTPMTLREIGRELGLSGERIRQIEEQALEKLHRRLVRAGITKDCLEPIEAKHDIRAMRSVLTACFGDDSVDTVDGLGRSGEGERSA